MTTPDDPSMQSAASDETLMERYAKGDAEAFDTLYERYEPRAYAFFLRRTGSPDRARDLFQELFLRIHRHRDRYEPNRPFSPWFFQIARCLLIDDIRRAFRTHEFALEGEPQDTGQSQTSPVLEFASWDFLLSGLSPEERHLIVAAKVEGIEYDELGRNLGKSAVAVRQTTSRAVRKLRRILERELTPEIVRI